MLSRVPGQNSFRDGMSDECAGHDGGREVHVVVHAGNGDTAGHCVDDRRYHPSVVMAGHGGGEGEGGGGVAGGKTREVFVERVERVAAFVLARSGRAEYGL